MLFLDYFKKFDLNYKTHSVFTPEYLKGINFKSNLNCILILDVSLFKCQYLIGIDFRQFDFAGPQLQFQEKLVQFWRTYIFFHPCKKGKTQLYQRRKINLVYNEFY